MKITIIEWAARQYSKPPSAWVLGKWRRNGEIYPPPERVGREWFVEEDAKRLVTGSQPRPSLVSRIAA